MRSHVEAACHVARLWWLEPYEASALFEEIMQARAQMVNDSRFWSNLR